MINLEACGDGGAANYCCPSARQCCSIGGWSLQPSELQNNLAHLLPNVPSLILNFIFLLWISENEDKCPCDHIYLWQKTVLNILVFLPPLNVCSEGSCICFSFSYVLSFIVLEVCRILMTKDWCHSKLKSVGVSLCLWFPAARAPLSIEPSYYFPTRSFLDSCKTPPSWHKVAGAPWGRSFGDSTVCLSVRGAVF